MVTSCDTTNLLVFSHFRWEVLFQRPQQLTTTFAKYRRMFYIEEPFYGAINFPRLELRDFTEKVQIIAPHLPVYLKSSEVETTLKGLIDEFLFSEKIEVYSILYITPLAPPYTRHLKPSSILFHNIETELLDQTETTSNHYIVLNEPH